MNQPDNKTGPEQQEGHQQPLPLFRPEALASQQQKLYGEILLIRPLSLAFLGWLGLAISASILGFLLLGQITEKTRVLGVLLPPGGGGASSDEAMLFVPDRILGFVQPGKQLWLVGPADQRQSATVELVSSLAVDPARAPFSEKLAGKGPMHRVLVVLSSPIGETAQPGSTKIEAEVALGKKSLIKWLFQRAGG
jgi:hypothetical protein